MRKIISRPNLRELPALPLPVHIRSVGYNEANFGWSERAPGTKKNLVQVFWNIQGRGEVIKKEGSFQVGPGDVFYHLPLEEHYHKSVDPDNIWCYHWFTFDGPGATDFIRAYGYSEQGFHAGECPTRLFLEIESLLKQWTPYAQRHALSVATEILALAGGTIENQAKPDLVKEFIEIVQADFADPEINVGIVADRLGIHRTTLNRLFYRAMSIPPSDYLAQIRIQRALSLLKGTNMPVKEIAYECGIDNISYFCRLIKQKTGLNPISYRSATWLD